MAPRREYLYFVEPKDNDPASELSRQSLFIKAMSYTDSKKVDVIAVPNGSKRTPWQQIQAKREGMKAGASDLIVTWDGGIVFAEFKDGQAMPRKEQHKWLNQKVIWGFNTGVFRTAAGLILFLHRNGAPLHPLTLAYAQ